MLGDDTIDLAFKSLPSFLHLLLAISNRFSIDGTVELALASVTYESAGSSVALHLADRISSGEEWRKLVDGFQLQEAMSDGWLKCQAVIREVQDRRVVHPPSLPG